MSFPVLNSASNTVVKSLGMVDNTIDMAAVITTIGKEAAENALYETRVENFKERKELAAGLSPEELAIIEAM